MWRSSFVGFAGKTDLDQLRVDMIVDSINDMMQVLFNAVRDTMSDDEKVLKCKHMIEGFMRVHKGFQCAACKWIGQTPSALEM